MSTKPKIITLDLDDIEIVLAVNGCREYDEEWVLPKYIYEAATAAPAMKHWTVRKFYARLRELAERGALERNPWVKRECYREAVGAIAAIDRAHGPTARLEVW